MMRRRGGPGSARGKSCPMLNQWPGRPRARCSNTHIEEEICRLRAELLRKDQDNERMQLQLAAEKEERERVQVGALGTWGLPAELPRPLGSPAGRAECRATIASAV